MSKHHRRILEQSAGDALDAPEGDTDVFLAGEVRDDLLRRLFVCCDEAQLVLALSD